MFEDEEDTGLRTLCTETLPGDDHCLTEEDIVHHIVSIVSSAHFKECNIVSVSQDVFDVLTADVDESSPPPLSPFFDRCKPSRLRHGGFAGRVMTRPVFLNVSAEDRTVIFHHLPKQGGS